MASSSSSPSPSTTAPSPVTNPNPRESTPPPPTSSPTTDSPVVRRPRTSTNASTASATSRLRSASIKLMEASPPPGMWAATGSVTSKAPTLTDIRTGSFSESGWNGELQRFKAEGRGSQGEIGRRVRRIGNTAQDPLPEDENEHQTGVSLPGGGSRSNAPESQAALDGVEPFPALEEEETNAFSLEDHVPSRSFSQMPSHKNPEKQNLKVGSYVEPQRKRGAGKQPKEDPQQYANGYVPPPKLPWTTSTIIALKAFWKWFLTPMGFVITLYGLNVVAWGGMLFLLLCNAAPAMCKPTCDDIESPRRKWVEIDSQILNALFCVTGFGLAPWRFRDLYWLTVWRLGKGMRKQTGMRRLAGIHRGWFRLPGSENLPEGASAANVSSDDPAVPIPIATIPDPPPTGIRAPPTKGWKMDFVVWMNVWNTFFQIVLCFYMWHYNRYDRPSWATGLFVALGSIVAGVAGIMMFVEGKAVKKVEGVPMPEGGYQEVPMDTEAQPLKTSR